MNRFARWAMGAFAITLSVVCGANAQTYPTKPVRLIVPYPAGGATDFFARTVFGKVGDVLGQPVVVENKPGAGTTIGSELVAKSPPDGYTLLIGDMGTYALNASLYRNLRYDPQKNFTPVSLTGRFALVLVVNPSTLPVKNMSEFLAYARSNPDKINYAAPGPGSPLHVTMDLFKQQAGIKMVAIPYKGGGDAINDLLSGQVQAMFLDITTAQAQLKGGRIRAIGIASEKRHPLLPDVPTVNESGVAGFESYAWQGFVAPAGTPPEVIAKLNSAFATAMQDPTVKQRLSDAAVDPLTGTPEQFASYMASETIKWARVIKASNIALD
ncbi:MAG: Bug family tripartite tricarboxylate transporter substrate binding protein [Rhodoferax sp.]